MAKAGASALNLTALFNAADPRPQPSSAIW